MNEVSGAVERDGGNERVDEIRGRYAKLRESQSQPGMHNLSMKARSAIRHNTERELARQDVPWLLDQLAALRNQLAEYSAVIEEQRAMIGELRAESPP